MGLDNSTLTRNLAVLADLGLTGLYVPEDDGGLGMGPIEGMVVMEELGRGIVMEPLAQTLIAGAVLSHYAGADVQAAWCGKVASGEALVVLAHQERNYEGKRNVHRTGTKDAGNMITTDKPLADHGLTSYRYRGRYGWIMIGARDDDDTPAVKLPTLKPWAWEAWKANQVGMTGTAIAATLAKKHNDPKITQPRVSEQIQRAKLHAEASGLADDAAKALPQVGSRAPARTLDPAAAEQGKRTDGKAHHLRERERQKAKDGDDEE